MLGMGDTVSAYRFSVQTDLTLRWMMGLAVTESDVCDRNATIYTFEKHI